MSKTGFLIHPKWEMMKTLSDKAVTNQSHRDCLMTVKDIKGQSSHALVRRHRPVTADSHAAPLIYEDSSLWLFSSPSHHGLAVLPLSHFFVTPPSCSALLVKARQKDAGSADRSGQVAMCYRGFWSDGRARVACCVHKRKRLPQNTHTRRRPHLPQNASLLPTSCNVLQHWHFFLNFSLSCSFSVLLVSSRFVVHLLF